MHGPPSAPAEAAVVAGSLLSLVAASVGYLENFNLLGVAAYAILIGTLVTNEFVVSRWRAGRDRELAIIDFADQKRIAA